MRLLGTLGALAVLVSALVVACGGSTDSDDNGKGGSASGGKAAVGGASSGGASSGGSSSGGSSSGGSSGGGAAGSGGSAGTYCGGFAESPCAPDEFCDFAPGSYCGGDDSPGYCVKKPQGCPEDCPGVCGCDGKFYCNACTAQQHGVDDSTSTQCMQDAGNSGVCGGLLGLQCAADEWCDLPGGCGFPDAAGICKKKPQGCTADCPGVCGCDGKFYCNVCGANAMGADTSDDKSCMKDGGGGGNACTDDNQCNKGLKCCYPCGIPGCQNQCMQPGPNGMCPLFP